MPPQIHAGACVITTVRCRRPGESGIQADHRSSGSASQWPSLVSTRDASPSIHKQQTRRLAAATACRSARKIAGVWSRILDEAIGGMNASSELAGWIHAMPRRRMRHRAWIDRRMAPADACVNHQHAKTQTTTVQAVCAGNPHPNEADAATTAVAFAAADRRHALQPLQAARHVPPTLTHDGEHVIRGAARPSPAAPPRCETPPISPVRTPDFAQARSHGAPARTCQCPPPLVCAPTGSV